MVGYHSVLLVRADSPYQTLDDLRDRSLAFTARLSASGFPHPLPRADQARLRAEPFFNHLAFAGGHPEAVAAVLNRRFRCRCDLELGDRRRARRAIRAGNLRRMVDRGLLDMGDVRILWQSELIPERAATSCAKPCRRRPRTSSERCCSIWPTAIVRASSGSSATARSTSNRSRTSTTRAWSTSAANRHRRRAPDPVGRRHRSLLVSVVSAAPMLCYNMPGSVTESAMPRGRRTSPRTTITPPCIDAALDRAAALCARRGARLTRLRRRVLELVWQGHSAVKAYDLLGELDRRRRGRQAAHRLPGAGLSDRPWAGASSGEPERLCRLPAAEAPRTTGSS